MNRVGHFAGLPYDQQNHTPGTRPAQPYAARYLVPYVRPFRLWKFGPRYDKIDGRYVDDGWYLDRYGDREISRQEAERIQSEQR